MRYLKSSSTSIVFGGPKISLVCYIITPFRDILYFPLMGVQCTCTQPCCPVWGTPRLIQEWLKNKASCSTVNDLSLQPAQHATAPSLLSPIWLIYMAVGPWTGGEVRGQTDAHLSTAQWGGPRYSYHYSALWGLLFLQSVKSTERHDASYKIRHFRDVFTYEISNYNSHFCRLTTAELEHRGRHTIQ